MLHEILLSLSGLPSPIWDQLNDQVKDGPSLKLYTSPAERVMLKNLGELSNLHLKVRGLVTIVSRSHPSPTCRATVNRITTKHLRAFTDAVIQIEAGILKGDATLVGAYKTVSLSTLLSRFQPWMRPMRWLYKTVQMLHMQDTQDPASEVTGAAMLEYLHKECHTGYMDVKDISSDLLIAAQKVWLQSLMPWVLYGQLPSFGVVDFLVNTDLTLRSHNVPYFITADTAEAVVVIGKALGHIKSQRNSHENQVLLSDLSASLVYTTLESVKSLSYPLETNAFTKVVREINENASQNILSQILSEELVIELLIVIQEYALLRNGEFSSSLIKHAAEATHLRTKADQLNRPVRRAGKRDAVQMSEAETAAILNKTWSDLATLAPEYRLDDSVTGKAIVWMSLKTQSVSPPVSTLLPTPSCISIELPENSPLQIFVSDTDVKKYQNLSAYFISLNRAQAHLTRLWRSSSHRRLPSTSGQLRHLESQIRQHTQKTRRLRREHRDRQLRGHWTSASRVLLVLSEISNFLHGNVMQKSWQHLWTWIHCSDSSRPSSSKGPSRPATSDSRAAVPQSSSRAPTKPAQDGTSASLRRDPRLLARAHKQYLDSLYHAVLLDNTEYTSALCNAFNTIDHYTALFDRLQKIWEDTDLSTDVKITSAFTDLPLEEVEVLKEMERTKATLTDQIQKLVETIGQVERQKGLSGISNGLSEISLDSVDGKGSGEFRAWNVRTLNPLLMKVDFVLNDQDEKFEDALLELSQDDS